MDALRTLASIGLATLFCVAGPSRVWAWTHATVDTDPGTTLYWRARRVEVRIAYGSCVDAPESAVRASVLQAMTEWSTAGTGCADMSLVEGRALTGGGAFATNLDGGDPDGENRLVWRQTAWPRDDAGEVIALTTLVYDRATGAIVDADIDVNGEDYYFTTTDDAGTVVTDVQNTVTHELGHLLGLGHSDVADATMYGSSDPGETSKRELDGDDVAAVCTVYPYGAPTPRGLGRSSGGLTSASGCNVGGAGHARAGTGLGWLAALALAAALAIVARRRARGARGATRARGLAHGAAGARGLAHGAADARGHFFAGSARARGARAARAGLGAVAVVAGLALAPGRASATVVVAFDLRELVDRADEVALVEAIDVRSLRDARGRIVTDTVVRVIESVEGGARVGDTFVIRRLGGVVGDLGMHVEGEATLAPGERAIVFAKRVAPSAPLRTVGMAQGVMPVRANGAHALVMPGGAGLVLVRPLPGGRLAPATAALTAPRALDELLDALRTISTDLRGP